MTGFRHLRTRLLLTYTGLIVAGFSILAGLAGRQISTTAVFDYQQSLQSQAVLVARGLSEPLEHYYEGEASSDDITTLIDTYAEQTGARITVMDAWGRPWLDTYAVPEGVASELPEVAAALAGRAGIDIRADEHRVQTLYVAAPLVAEEREGGVVRLAVPLSATNQAIFNRWLVLGSSVGLVTLLALVTSLLLARSLTQPLEKLRASALQMADGNLSVRLAEDRADEIGELARAFNHLAAQVQAMLDEQRAFASNASHELRTPLTTIRLRSEALRGGTLDERMSQQYIAEIDSEVARLGHLVDDLILLSRFDAHRAERGQEEVDPLRLARSLMAEVASYAHEQAITLTLEASSELPTIQTSSTHMRVVFRNLLDNALKYTQEGGAITWTLNVKREFLCSNISDNGQGIAAEALPHIMKRFYRADKSRGRAVAGAGLGLSLVSSITEFYGGRIQIESPGTGCGTTVKIWWPLMAKTP